MSMQNIQMWKDCHFLNNNNYKIIRSEMMIYLEYKNLSTGSMSAYHLSRKHHILQTSQSFLICFRSIVWRSTSFCDSWSHLHLAIWQIQSILGVGHASDGPGGDTYWPHLCWTWKWVCSPSYNLKVNHVTQMCQQPILTAFYKPIGKTNIFSRMLNIIFI